MIDRLFRVLSKHDDTITTHYEGVDRLEAMTVCRNLISQNKDTIYVWVEESHIIFRYGGRQ